MLKYKTAIVDAPESLIGKGNTAKAWVDVNKLDSGHPFANEYNYAIEAHLEGEGFDPMDIVPTTSYDNGLKEAIDIADAWIRDVKNWGDLNKYD